MTDFFNTYHVAIEWLLGSVLFVAILKFVWLIGIALWKQIKRGTYDI